MAVPGVPPIELSDADWQDVASCLAFIAGRRSSSITADRAYELQQKIDRQLTASRRAMDVHAEVSPRDWERCRVFWGSHGCMYERGHDGPHECSCAFGPDGKREPREDAEGVLNVGAPPYYGTDTTKFYGEDTDG